MEKVVDITFSEENRARKKDRGFVIPTICRCILHRYWTNPRVYPRDLIAVMISYYSGGELQQLDPKRCRKHPCNEESITCHNHGPMDMEKFVLAHS